MRKLRSCIVRLFCLFDRKHRERETADEMQANIELHIDDGIRGGLTPEQARRAALLTFGSLDAAQEAVRDSRRIPVVETLVHDVRYALRQIERNPGFVVVAALTLGLGIGANTAIFSIVNTVLLRPLPYKDSDRLVRIVENIPAAESLSGAPERTTTMSPEAFLQWRSSTKTLSGMAMERDIPATLRGPQTLRLSGFQVSPALFQMLGVQPALGRVFDTEEEKPGFDKRAILSYGAWQRIFAGNPNILGSTITIDDAAYTVVGIMPRQFIYPDPGTEFWTPLALPLPGLFGLRVIAKLKDGVPLAAAAEEANVIGRYLRGEPAGGPQSSGPPRIQLMTVKEELVGAIRLPFLIFVIAVSFVLLIACVNVANLFLARATTRTGEIRIRMALGASRGRLFRQLLTENFILAILGGGAGVVTAFAGIRFFKVLGQTLPRTDLIRLGLTGNAIPRLNEVGMDVSALLFTLALTVATGILFGFVPALQIRRTAPIHAASNDPRFAGSSSLAVQWIRTIMVTGQISLTLILLLGAGLLLKSFLTLANTRLGYDPSNVLTFKIPQPALEYPEDGPKQRQQNAFAEEVVRRLEALPDIQAAAFTNALPMVQGFWSWVGGSQGVKPKDEGRSAVISPDYFKAMGIRLVAGRAFSESDRSRRGAMYLVNRAAVKEYFEGVNPIGKTISTFAGTDRGEIVGIVDDTRQSGPDSEPVPQIFLHPEHMNNSTFGEGYYFVVRTTRSTAAVVPVIRSIVRDLDPKVVVDDIATMNQIVSNSITTPRSYAVLLGTFSVAALALASIGLYGVLSYFIKQRTREIGIRIALGAESGNILRLVLRQGLGMSVAGLLFGLAGSAALTRYLRNMLFQVTPWDSVTFIVVSGFFMAVALLASYVPARHAATIDPISALRHE